MSKHYQVIIIGGGPAGVSAGIWCADLGLNALILESRAELGGQLHRIYNPITNYPGVETAQGKELSELFVTQLRKTATQVRTGVQVRSVDAAARSIVLASGEGLSGDSLIIATGVRRRVLGGAGEDKFRGNGILESGVRSKNDVAGKHVVIVGGGDAAVENALILSETAESVTVIHRRDRFSARPEFLSRLGDQDNLRTILNSRVKSFVGHERLKGLIVEDIERGETQNLYCDLALIRIGVEPNSELFSAMITLNKGGYIQIDHKCRTNVTDVYAIGDVASHGSPTISTATGTAATAVKQIAE